MLRSAFLYLAGQQQIFKFVRNNRLAKSFANRFVAGETLDSALTAVARLNARGITASLDLLGESVHNEAEANAAGEAYITMGLDISEDLCVTIMHKILGRARDCSSFVRIDMESSEYTEKTLDLFERRLYPAYPQNVGIVLQSYLFRTFADVERAILIKARVRLCKGAYKEPETVAYPDKKEVDSTYIRCMHELMRHGNYPGIATHDEAIIKEAKRFARENNISSDRFEFQMLYGVRRDLQDMLVREGYRMRVYVPFGTQWYPYLMRRLAERPANVAFLTGSMFKEMVGRRRR